MLKSTFKISISLLFLIFLSQISFAQEVTENEKPTSKKEKKIKKKKKKRAKNEPVNDTTKVELTPEEKKELKAQKKVEKKENKTAKKEARKARLKAEPPIETYRTNGRKYNLTGVRIGTELGQYLFQYIDPGMLLPKYYEIHTDFQINNKFFINADYGFVARKRSLASSNLGFAAFYDSEGTYMRFGVDYNILHKTTDDDAIFAGIRYASTSFKHEITYRGNPDYWYLNRPETFNDDNLKAQWAELVFGFKAKLFWQLYMGVTTRIQIITSQPNASFTVVDLPGHGFEDPNSSSKFNVSYYIMYRIPLWK